MGGIMDNRLLLELTKYIEKKKTECISVREMSENYNYVMPMKSVHQVIPSKTYNSEDENEDKTWLERFRKKPADKPGNKSKNRPFYDLPEAELERYINKSRSNETFSTKLLQYIDRSGLADAEIYKKAGIDRRHFSKIRCDKNYSPKKSTVIALCIALELDLKETEEMLKLAGYSLSNSDTGDLVVKFFIERKIYDLMTVNEALDYFGQKMLGIVG